MASASTTSRTTWRGRQITGVSFDLQDAMAAPRAAEAFIDRLPWFQERAIQTLYRALPVEARRDIQAEFNIRAGRVREHMTIRYLASPTARRAGVRLFGQWKRGIGLSNYSARQVRKGVSYSVYHGRRKVLEGAFMTRLRQGSKQLGNVHAVLREGEMRERTYRHTGRNGRMQTGKRTDPALVTQYRSTVAQMLAHGRRPERLLDFSRGLVQSEVLRQANSYLRGSRRT